MSLWAFRFVLFYLLFLLVQPQVRFPFLAPWRPAFVCIIISAVLHIMSASSEGKPLIRFGPATISALFLMFFSYLSNHFGPFMTNTWWNPEIDYIFKNCMAMILIEAMATTVERAWAVFGTIAFATLWWVKAGVRLSAVGATFTDDRLMGPGVGLLTNPNAFAFAMVLMIPIYLYFFQHSRSKLFRWGFLVCAPTAMYIVFQTGSRTGFLCLAGCLLLVVPRFARKQIAILPLLLLGGFIGLSMTGERNIDRFRTIYQSYLEFTGQVEQKPVSEMNRDELSSYERKMKNVHSWELVKRYPVFGVGLYFDYDLVPEELQYARGTVHNDWLYTGLQMGFIGMGIYASLLVIIAFAGFKIQRAMKPQWPALADLGWMLKVFVGIYMIGGFFSPNSWSALLMSVTGAASALWLDVKKHSWNTGTEKY